MERGGAECKHTFARGTMAKNETAEELSTSDII